MRKTLQYLKTVALIVVSTTFLLFSFGIITNADTISQDSNRKTSGVEVVTSSEITSNLTVESSKDLDGFTVTETPHHGDLYLKGSKVSTGQYITTEEILDGSLVYQSESQFQGADKFKYTTGEHTNTSSYNFDIIKDQIEQSKRETQAAKDAVQAGKDHTDAQIEQSKQDTEEVKECVEKTKKEVLEAIEGYQNGTTSEWDYDYGYQQGPRDGSATTHSYSCSGQVSYSDGSTGQGGGSDNSVEETDDTTEEATTDGPTIVIDNGGEEIAVPVGGGAGILVRSGGANELFPTLLVFAGLLSAFSVYLTLRPINN